MRKMGVVVGFTVVVLVLFLASFSMFENVKAGEIHVKQAAISGEMTVISKPGLYGQWFGIITKYKVSDEIYLSSSNQDGDTTDITDAVQVRFNDGSKAKISAVTKWRMPVDPNQVLKIHQDFRSFDAFKAYIRQYLMEVSMQTSSIYKAEDVYSTKRAELAQMIRDQLINGLYATEQIEVLEPSGELDDKGSPMMTKTLRPQIKIVDKVPVITDAGVFRKYNVDLVGYNLKAIEFDEQIEMLIAKKKESEQARVVARANADRARQDRVTAVEQGAARIAVAQADEEVEKIKAVTNAKKDQEVAALRALQAKSDAEAALSMKRAEATAAELLVKAGLTPQEKAKFQMDTAIGVAEALAKTEWPKIMTFGGDAKATNPLEAIGYNQMFDLVTKVSGK